MQRARFRAFPERPSGGHGATLANASHGTLRLGQMGQGVSSEFCTMQRYISFASLNKLLGGVWSLPDTKMSPLACDLKLFPNIHGKVSLTVPQKTRCSWPKAPLIFSNNSLSLLFPTNHVVKNLRGQEGMLANWGPLSLVETRICMMWYDNGIRPRETAQRPEGI